MIAFRRAHPVFRRRRFFEGRPTSRGAEISEEIHDIAWFTPDGREMTEQDWEVEFGRAIAVYLNGEAIDELDHVGEQVVDDSFVLYFNAHEEDLQFTAPPVDFGREWAVVVDTASGRVLVETSAGPGDPADGYGGEQTARLHEQTVAADAMITVRSRSLLVLQRLP
jgi:glycogen operon protein